LQKYENDVTRKTYTRQFKLFVKFCREIYDCKNFDECKEHIQDYSDYLQMENYIEDLKSDGVNVSKVLFDVKDYYNSKSRKFFINYGLTPAQVNDAFAGAKDGLDLLITLGSTRRKKMK
jgi:hypothetical protein